MCHNWENTILQGHTFKIILKNIYVYLYTKVKSYKVSNYVTPSNIHHIIDNMIVNSVDNYILFKYVINHPIKVFMSSSTVVIVPTLNFSTKTFKMSGVKNAGNVGPVWIFFTPRLRSASRTITAFCSYHAIL